MKSQLIDPRDAVAEVDSPIYRVYFRALSEALGGATSEYQITDAQDVEEVVDWARLFSDDEFDLWLETSTSDGIKLHRLHHSPRR